MLDICSALNFLATTSPSTRASTLTICITPTASPRISKNTRLDVPAEIIEQTFSNIENPAPSPTAALKSSLSVGSKIKT